MAFFPLPSDTVRWRPCRPFANRLWRRAVISDCGVPLVPASSGTYLAPSAVHLPHLCHALLDHGHHARGVFPVPKQPWMVHRRVAHHSRTDTRAPVSAAHGLGYGASRSGTERRWRTGPLLSCTARGGTVRHWRTGPPLPSEASISNP